MKYLAIGCSDYKFFTKLKYIDNDLKTMESRLEFAGFTGDSVLNCTHSCLMKNINNIVSQESDITLI